ncbi:alpha-N-acetylglucosaminidase [Drosophila willistoni]|uniref:alpha-N-acetylglucosaminidase n=1 Tax=Drosophila willistoni TaxID=7260 RepID=UPI001F07A93F|nr:alpha-N-acetylglucosaminidase [Drosophila willistoni]
MVGALNLSCILICLLINHFDLGLAQYSYNGAIDVADALGPKLAGHVFPDVSPDVQEQAARDVIKRVIGKKASESFEVEVNRLLDVRSFQISMLDSGKILIAGWDGTSVCKGFHQYLKYQLNKDVDWFKMTIELPVNQHLPNVSMSSTSASPIIYYQNVCTWGYSFAWWNFQQWRRNIDWMALMGISLTIAPIQEFIWQDIYTQLGLNLDEIEAHFAGPAFQPWQRMGNIRGWGGGSPNQGGGSEFRRLQYLLQQQIIQAQRELGISVALPAFAGHVPRALRRIFPQANFTETERWNRFPNAYCCDLFVEPQEPLFRQLATTFLRRVTQRYGSNHIFFCDPFNELEPPVSQADFMRSTAAAIYASMREVDPKAIWLLQGWMFVKNIFWTDELIEAFLTAVPQGNLLVLDLQSEQFPQYQRTKSYYGQPFVWCMLHNFGGTLGMLGSVELVNSGMDLARQMPNSSMVGAGITPEGIGQNYVMYSFALERGWSDRKLDSAGWFTHFALTRYGVQDERLNQAWQLLRTSVYTFHGLQKMRGKYTITRRPAINLSPFTWYNVTHVLEAWQLMLSARSIIPLDDNRYDIYQHDLVDITRQYLQITADQLYVNLNSSYRKRQLARFVYLGNKLLELLDDLERILGSGSNFLLGTWLEAAKLLAPTVEDQSNFEFNARNQITTWGPNGEILDYACKQWSGMISDYYRPRWARFLDDVTLALQSNQPFNASAYKQHVLKEIEKPFSKMNKQYPVRPSGDPWLISQDIFEKWSKYTKDTKYLHNNRLQLPYK